MIRTLLAALAFFGYALPAVAQCPPADYDRARLQALSAAEWAIADAPERNAFARALVPCLSSSDPALRDGVAFAALSHMLRGQQLSAETMRALADELDADLFAPDPDGVARPFAALALSEVARADRIDPFLDAGVRARLLDNAILFFTQVRDYRGFDETEGWRHGVAHGADLLLQLGINPAFGKAEQVRVLTAIETQIAPEGHFYVYGEPERLARPLTFIAQGGRFTEAEWTAYFGRLATGNGDVYSSQAGLAWRHNVFAFLAALHLNASISEDVNDDSMLPGLEAALRALP